MTDENHWNIEDVLPVTPQALAELYGQVLGLGDVGTDDSFYDLGGDDGSTIRLVRRARAAGVLLKPKDVYEHETPAALAPVARQGGASPDPLDDVGVGAVAVTPIIEAFRAHGGLVDRFFQAMLIATPAGLDTGGVTRLLQAVVDHHDVLRLRVAAGEDGLSLTVRPAGAVPVQRFLKRVDCRELSGERLRTTVVTEYEAAGDRLGFAADSLLQLVWFDHGPDRAGTLLVVIHHVAVDGVSWRILLQDLAAGWAAISAGKPIGLAATGTSFRRWSMLLAAAAHAPARTAELPVWQGILAPAEPLVCAGLDPGKDVYATAVKVSRRLQVDRTVPLLGTVPSAFGAGIQDILLAAFGFAAARWAHLRGRPDGPVVVDVEGHGRDESVAPGVDLSRTLGWFTSMYPVRLDPGVVAWDDLLAGGAETRNGVERIKEQVRAVPGGLGFGLLRHLNVRTRAQLGTAVRPDIGFNYLGRVSSTTGHSPWTPRPGPGEGGGFLGGGQADMPLFHVLDLNAITYDTADGPQLVANWTFAGGHLTEAEVGELADLWFAALRAIAAGAGSGRG
ncbi:condensation domain-containing protein [Amycolatopsis sp., V23-08]|uniref:Condensation domain-containing protein n=1 Tax=Amycolatopsis heterodermiae TaxID=3110235 RepID=A0ABU5R234_9PSEU|nr:condensation domain-containing protein [Amycolatopsis sp., V23-08]MEA5360271.1 condensation domain-containing protein [Amycolatopsis sp., V23-08]